LEKEFLDSKLIEKVLIKVLKHKGSLYNYFDKSDICLASKRAMKNNEKKVLLKI